MTHATSVASRRSIHSSIRSKPAKQFVLYDGWFLFAAFAIILIGLVMVASSSIVISERIFHQPFHYFFRQGIYLLMGIVFAAVIVRVDTEIWRRMAGWFMVVGFILLIAVLIPGIGRSVNGSARWIAAGPIAVQVSELAKFFTIIYMADYLVRRDEEVRTRVVGFLKPMFLLCIMALLLLKEPDFGATTVIMATALGLMFLAGVRLWQFAILLGIVVLALSGLAISSPYRMARLTTFLNPWANQFDSGYQLTQSLIAFGRGGWFGAGLGQSVQKLFYLPEAHTDFLFSVTAEELGLIGVIIIMSLFILLVGRIFVIAKRAQDLGNNFSAYLAFGFALWIAMQAIINIGVDSGVLPTKGLTLPLMSYGGSSVVVMCFVLALVARIDFENRVAKLKKY